MPPAKVSTGTRYRVFGPFPFALEQGQSHRAALSIFWHEREQDGSLEGLDQAVGVYVWTHLEGGRRLPWNVGLTNKQGFKSRFFQKSASFLRLVIDGSANDVQVYLLALMTPSGKFRKATESNSIGANEWLETTLISMALAANPALRNVSKAQKQKTVVVEGFLNDKELSTGKSAKSLRRVFKAKL